MYLYQFHVVIHIFFLIDLISHEKIVQQEKFFITKEAGDFLLNYCKRSFRDLLNQSSNTILGYRIAKYNTTGTANSVYGIH